MPPLPSTDASFDRYHRHRRPLLPPPPANPAAGRHGRPGPPRPLQSVAEDLVTGAILADLAAIFAAHSQTVHKDGTARTLDECSGRGIHSLL